jgi:hypothetical protein
MACPTCEATATTERSGRTELGYRRLRCRDCQRACNERAGAPFNRRQYAADVVRLVAPWRCRHRFSLRDLAERVLPRGMILTHEAVRNWGWGWPHSPVRDYASGVMAPSGPAGMPMRRISGAGGAGAICTVPSTAMGSSWTCASVRREISQRRRLSPARRGWRAGRCWAASPRMAIMPTRGQAAPCSGRRWHTERTATCTIS